MGSNDLKTSMVIAGRGARACDMCGKERARWYCAADEAYLCERCDITVHSANAVAKRHERVKLGPNGTPVKLKPSRHSRKRKSNGSNLPSNNADDPQSRSGDVRKWCNTSRKRSRTFRKSCKSSGHLLLSPAPAANPDQSSMSASVKEEKDDTGLLLYDLLTTDDQFGDLPGTVNLDVKTEPISPSSTLTTRDILDVKVEDVEFAHEVPTYEPLLQDLIDSSHKDFMGNLMPSSPSVCNASCSSRVSSSTKLKRDAPPADPQCEEHKADKMPFEMDTEALHISDLVDSTAGDINESISISEDSDIDTFDVMDLCSNANYDETRKDELGKADEFRESYPDMELWKSAYQLNHGACTSIFEGNPFKGKGERVLDEGCNSIEDLPGEDVKPLPQCPQICAMKPYNEGCINVDPLSTLHVKPLQTCPQQCTLERALSLRLDYEDVINAWSDKGSLWMDGQRPQLVPDISFPSHYGGMVLTAESSCNFSMSSQAGQVPSLVVFDRGREARVLRYKEKRRTRLFSKKIRYEVRKLNAERRPRMKGRFVKRAAIAAIASM